MIINKCICQYSDKSLIKKILNTHPIKCLQKNAKYNQIATPSFMGDDCQKLKHRSMV